MMDREAAMWAEGREGWAREGKEDAVLKTIWLSNAEGLQETKKVGKFQKEHINI